MEGVVWMGWALAAVLAVVVIVLVVRRPGGAGASTPDRGRGAGGAPTPTRTDAAAPAATPSPASASGPDPLHGTLGYLRRAVIPDLEALRDHEGIPAGSGAELLERALDALEDLAFYAEPPLAEDLEVADLAPLVQEAVRQYTIETRVPVRVHPSPVPLRAPVRREGLKDAVFMLLANAGQYSGGRPVDVYLEAPPAGGFRIRIVDEGPGFSDEALDRAIEPFWSTDPRGVGLGLPQARARVLEMKGRISLKNQTDGGGEVVLDFPAREDDPAA